MGGNSGGGIAAAQMMSFKKSIDLKNKALAFSQSALIGDERVLFGGITAINNKSAMRTDDPTSYFFLNASVSSVSINANPAAPNPEWNSMNFSLPMPLSGVFSTQHDNTIYVTPMGTQMDWGTGCDDCVWYAKLNADGPIEWIKIPFDPSMAPRRKAGLSASGTKLRLFGGVTKGSDEAIREVLTYCLIDKEWYIEAQFSYECNEAAQLSSCAVFCISEAEYMLSCVAPNMRTVMIGTWLPAVNNDLTNAYVYTLDNPLVGGMSVTQMGQYLVGFGQRIGAPGTFSAGCSPYILTVDMTTGATFPLAASSVACRFGPSVYSNGPSLFLAGGIDPDTMRLSDAVETAAFGPRIAHVSTNGQRSFTVGETLDINVQLCAPGTIFRFANSPTCQTMAAGTVDTPCVPAGPGEYNSGTVSFPLNSKVKSAYLCVSFGSCQVPRANRTACPFARADTDFYGCTSAGCCYDPSNFYGGTDRCYAYVPPEQAASDPDDPASNSRVSRTRYFTLVNPTVPFTVGDAPKPDEPSESFFGSVKGIAILSGAGAAALLIIAGVLFAIARVRTKSAEESALEDGDNASEGAAADEVEGEFYGKYKILKKLGQGGFGSVFLVERATDKKILALKHIICKDEEERNYAVTEFEILYAAQGHENMITLEEMVITWQHRAAAESVNGGVNGSSAGSAPIRSYTEKRKSSGSSHGGSGGGSGRKKGELAPLLLQVAPKAVCIVMDYCPDGDLSAYVTKVYQLTGRALPEHLLLRVVADQVCSLLIHLQSRTPPICHRDLKPENILLKDNATKVIVTDFGLAQSLEKSFMSTRAGTLHYMAPECWKRHYTATVDMWALGCILYACATVRVDPQVRRVMFHDAKRPSFRQEIAHDLRDYSELFRTVVMGLLVVDPAKRLTAENVLQLLHEH